MKKIFIAVCIFTMLSAASTVWAVPVIGPWNYASPIDSILGYDQFSPANEAEELAFANSVLASLGMGTTELLNGTGMKVNIPSGTKDIVYNPGFVWVYAVVKVDGPNDYSYLFWDNQAGGGDDVLNPPVAGTLPFNMRTPPLGISHITWFGPTQVPEPMTLFLLGLGLLGVAGIRRKSKG